MCLVVGGKGVGDYYHSQWSKRFCCHDKETEFQETALLPVINWNGQFIKAYIWNYQEASFQFVLKTFFFPFSHAYRSAF